MDQKWAREALQKYITKKIYEKIYPNQKTYKDAALYIHLKTLEWVGYENLDIKLHHQVSQMWQFVADALLKMDK